MRKIHEKSLCCEEAVVRFGGRRRQCARCRRTWSLYQHRRGRKPKRGLKELARRYLANAQLSSHARAAVTGKPADRFEGALKRSRDLFLRTTPWHPLPDTWPLIAVADAFIKRIGGRWRTLYLILIRRPHDTHAVIAPLILKDGLETRAGWSEAFVRLPRTVQRAVRVLVCDGHRGLTDHAKHQGWLLQRCHFHLIAAVQGRRSRWGKSLHRAEGEQAYRLVKTALTTFNDDELLRSLRSVEDLALSTTSPQLRRILLGFRNASEDYRTYLNHPELHVPSTSNSAESFFSLVEQFCRRTRGFVSTDSFMRWLTALAKNKQVIACRERNQQN